MRIIDGLENFMNSLKPYLPQIEEAFNEENERYKALIEQDHKLIGRVLKSHLILEQYLNKFLLNRYSGLNLKKTKAQILDRSKRGNELYIINMIPNYPLKYLKYEDPSTANKVYGCFVPSTIESADEAMAWKFQITEEEYVEDLIFEA